MESDTSAGGSDGHRGELSLLEFMQTMLPSLEADAPSAAMAIRLSEEQHRRQARQPKNRERHLTLCGL